MVSSVSDASGAMFDSYGGDFVDPAVDYTEEAANGLNNDLLNNYDSQFLDPMLNNTLNTSQVMNNGLANDFSNTNNQMLSIGSSSASKLFSIYDKDFFQPMKRSISELANELKSLDTSKLQPATFQSIANLQRVSAPTIKNTSNNVVNNSTNYSRSNTYANVYNSGGYGASSSVNDYLKRLYRKP